MTLTSLQSMINLADKYILDRGLRFSPLKTECVHFSQYHFVSSPAWSFNDVELVNSHSIKYLGVTLANKPSVHVIELPPVGELTTPYKALDFVM